MSGGIASPLHSCMRQSCCSAVSSPLMVWKVHSPVIPTTAVGCGTSPTPHSLTFHILFGYVIQPPGVQPFFVLLEKLRNLCWIHSNCMCNRQVYSHLLPHFRELLVEALQPIPPCSPLNGAKSFLTIPDCHLIGKYSQLILGKGEPSSRIDHDGFHQASFLFYFREEIKEVGGLHKLSKRRLPTRIITCLKLVKVTRLNLPAFKTFAVCFPPVILPL